MTKEQFESEKNYRVSISIAKAMLNKGIINQRDYAKIDTILLQKYKPILASLCA